MNLVTMAMGYLGPVVADRVAAKLGLGGPVVHSLIEAALPALMGGIIGKSKSSSGLETIMEMVTGDDRPQANMLEDLFDTGGDVDGLATAGGGLLEALLSGSGMSALSEALGRHADVDQSDAGSLLGMLAPAALGSIGDQVSEQGLEAAGLAQFLEGQAGNVAQAMPAGFAAGLDGSGLLDGISDSLSGDVAVEAVAERAESRVDVGVKKGKSKWPLIVTLIFLALLVWFLSGRGGAPEGDTSAAIPSSEFVAGDVD